jgi:L-seryl-tRNA(Ser) seleniumtransferase
MSRANSQDTPDNDKLRALPSVDRLLLELPDAVALFGHRSVTAALRDVLDVSRSKIVAGGSADMDPGTLKAAALQLLQDDAAPSLRKVFNLTGTVLHTNLGRAILPEEAIEAINTAASENSNLEFDLASGKRGDRESHVENLICELTGAEAATAVNNNAAAVLLVLNTLAKNLEVPVSRGELVEIGGSFRIPEVMQGANCTLVEIGATNRTHLRDYRAAINDKTALLMKVHTSNYKIEGFTKEVTETELAELAAEFKIPFVMDLGSGSLLDLKQFGLPAEPTAGDVIRQGADLVTFSGDKLLGGPQSGLIAGRADLIDRIRKNPLKRALRLDKMTLAGIAAVLKLYRDPDTLAEKLPTLRHLTRTPTEIRSSAERIGPALQNALGDQFRIEILDVENQVGSGSLPTRTVPGIAIAVHSATNGEDRSRDLSTAFRNLPTPVIGYVHKAGLHLDLRCLDDETGFLGQLGSLQI